MAILKWLSDADLDECIDELTKRISLANQEALKRVEKNVLDPFSLICVANAKGFSSSHQLLGAASLSSMMKGVSSATGNFHQDVLGRVSGFINHDAGYDLESKQQHIIAEVKNKHNTMNATARAGTVSNLKTHVSAKPGYKGYLVIIIPRKPKRYQKTLGKNLYEVDGATFYELVTGHKNALRELCDALAKRLSPNQAIASFISQQYHKSLPK